MGTLAVDPVTPRMRMMKGNDKGWGIQGDGEAGREPPEVQCSNIHRAPEGSRAPG